MKILTPFNNGLIIALFHLFTSGYAYANYFKISPIIQNTMGERVTYTITSENETKDQYIQMKITKVISPKNGDEKEIELDKLNEIKVIPDKLILKPNDQKKVQVVILNQGVEKEQVYRVFFNQISEDEYYSKSKSINSVSANASMTLALGAVLRIVPKVNVEDLLITGESVKNNGNTHFTIIEECVGLSHDSCIWEKPELSINVYSGNRYKWKSNNGESVMKAKIKFPQDKKLITINKNSFN